VQSEALEPLGLHYTPAEVRAFVEHPTTSDIETDRRKIKFTRPGGAIEVAVARKGSTATLVVRDSGVGIAADSLPTCSIRSTGPRPRDRRRPMAPDSDSVW
jgi:hypothetical protein